MNVAFQVEGDLDAEVLVHLVGTILNCPIEPELYRKRVGGMGEVFRTLTNAIWDAWRKRCIGFVVGVDANGTTPHDQHAADDDRDCRHCKIRNLLPLLPDRPPDQPLRFAIAVPAQALEAWLLQFAHLAKKSCPGPPQRMDRKDAKRLLWGAVSPPDRALVRQVCGDILPRLGPAELETLARAQPSFATFRSAVLQFR